MLAPPVTALNERIDRWIGTEGGDHALQLITVDGYARPHIMLLARDEVCVVSPSHLRVAVGKGSRSEENLRTRSSATVSIYDADLACVVKTRVVSGPRELLPGSVAYDLIVEDVRLDVPAAAEGSARLVSGLRFEGRSPRTDIQDALRKM